MPLSLSTRGLLWGAFCMGLFSSSVSTVWNWLSSGAIAAPEDAIGLEGLSVTVVQHGWKRKLEEIES